MGEKNKMILKFVIGTRPEIIKMMPIIEKCEGNHLYKILFTSQHFSPNMGRKLFNKYNFNVNNLIVNSSKNVNTLNFLNQHIEKTDKVVVQGDTRSAYYGAVVGHMKGCNVYHVEAGLRTFDFNSPYPEEFYRTEITKLSTKHFTPTSISFQNLLQENVKPENVILCGNPIIQSLDRERLNDDNVKTDTVVVTIHRGENKKHVQNIVNFLLQVARFRPEFTFNIVLHPNNYLKDGFDNVKLEHNMKLLEPLSYNDFLILLNNCKFAITDSGGLQEECCKLKTFCFVVRDTTERPESVSAGYSELVKPQTISTKHGYVSSRMTSYGLILQQMKDNPYYDKDCLDKIIAGLQQ